MTSVLLTQWRHYAFISFEHETVLFFQDKEQFPARATSAAPDVLPSLSTIAATVMSVRRHKSAVVFTGGQTSNNSTHDKALSISRSSKLPVNLKNYLIHYFSSLCPAFYLISFPNCWVSSHSCSLFHV